MISKLIAVFAVAALVYGIAGDVNACERSHRCDSRHSSSDVTVEVDNEDTHVINVAGSLANTGLNKQEGEKRSRQILYTGTVTSVTSLAAADVNSTTLPSCLLCSSSRTRGDVKVEVDNEDTHVINAAISVGNTGMNKQEGEKRSRSTMGTGAVAGVGSTANVFVNYTDMSVE